jgi:hypothetical protein
VGEREGSGEREREGEAEEEGERRGEEEGVPSTAVGEAEVEGLLERMEQGI